MKIVLIGANGQLGSDLAKVLTDEDLVLLTHADIEVTDMDSVKMVLTTYKPNVVLNMAAFHKVDACEDEVEKSFAVNAYGVRNLALTCRQLDATLLHVSTDYVFDGRKKAPYVESDVPRPINVYGVSKLAGEYFVRYLMDKYFLLRVSGLYGGASSKGDNFVELMLRLACEGKDIKVVNDQCLSPTYTVDLARKIKELVRTAHYGLIHVTSNGSCTWYEFAQKIFELSGLSPRLEPVTTATYGSRAMRPMFSELANNRLTTLGLNDMMTWQEGLITYLEKRC